MTAERRCPRREDPEAHRKKARPICSTSNEVEIEITDSTSSDSWDDSSSTSSSNVQNDDTGRESVGNAQAGVAANDPVNKEETNSKTKGKKSNIKVRCIGSDSRMSTFPCSCEGEYANIISWAITSTTDETENNFTRGIETKCLDDNRHVSFSSVEVMEFEYALGTGSVSCQGPPVCVSSNLVNKQGYDIDRYEAIRSYSRRHYKDLHLTVLEREDLLLKSGYTEEEIGNADFDGQEIRFQRWKSVDRMAWDGWAARKESVGRTIRKLTNSLVFLKSQVSQFH